jgi:hypothetical protein
MLLALAAFYRRFAPAAALAAGAVPVLLIVMLKVVLKQAADGAKADHESSVRADRMSGDQCSRGLRIRRGPTDEGGGLTQDDH